MISHDESAVLRKFKCTECDKAFKFKHHLKVKPDFTVICKFYLQLFFYCRNTLEFTVEKNLLNVEIVVNDFPIRDLILVI